MNENICCTKCNGTNIVKAGKKPDGRQIYLCKDCVSRFIESPKRKGNPSPINENIECLSCQSKNLVRAGHRLDGRQLYLCKDCNYNFVWIRKLQPRGPKSRPPQKTNTVPAEVYCRKCESRENVSKAGKHPDGRQIYKCKACDCIFLWDIKDRGGRKEAIPEKIVCVQCRQREHLVRRGKQWNGKQLYFCKECNKSFCEDSVAKKPQIPPDTTCRRCGGGNLTKAGTTRTGGLRVHCKDCNTSYALLGRKKPILPDGIYCVRCEGTDITTRGQERGTRMYQCKNCQYRFAWQTEE